MDCQAGECFEHPQGLECRMAVLVVDAGRDDGDVRVGDLDERTGRGGGRSVMAHLQHLDRRHEAAAEKDLLDRRLGVAGEQRLELAVSQEEHDRAVVDVALRQRRGRIGL